MLASTRPKRQSPQLPYWLELIRQAFAELLQCPLVFVGQQNLLRGQAVLERVQAYGGLLLRSPGPVLLRRRSKILTRI